MPARANLRLLLAYQYTRPGKALVFMGTELAPWSEWNHDASLDWSLRFDVGATWAKLKFTQLAQYEFDLSDVRPVTRSSMALYPPNRQDDGGGSRSRGRDLPIQ